jgi:hypothetical protein
MLEHFTLSHGYCKTPGGVLLQSIGVQLESNRSLPGVHQESNWSPSGVHEESNRSPTGVHQESN